MHKAKTDQQDAGDPAPAPATSDARSKHIKGGGAQLHDQTTLADDRRDDPPSPAWCRSTGAVRRGPRPSAGVSKALTGVGVASHESSWVLATSRKIGALGLLGV